ncbi:hypothetical protein [Actinomadura macrotermitis]|uniref:Uncharacterized protein n=1 Tax=Actinomadura macrotermitis TaxID=2585200 RepID=A0A7K0BY16_9ACTN|nr:hypothetical protein [Actinomadura macrotermitis]MQY06081.1 hypothetical protein [Actinomadura macrotermitis]
MNEVDRLVRALTPENRAEIAFLDLQRLRHENEGGGFQRTEPIYGVLNSLRYWENLVCRMEENEWAESSYMVYEYLNDLCVRDTVEDYLDAVRPALRARMERYVDRLDARFTALTRDDSGAEPARYWRPLADGEEVRWWWTRRPVELPRGW